MKRRISFILLLALVLSMTACGSEAVSEDAGLPVQESYDNAVQIALSDSGITVDGAAIDTDTAAAVYAANDIVYYEAGQDFTYGEGTAEDEHTADEAAAHTVVHITAPGEYLLTGKLSAGQIAVDLGEDAESDPTAVVTLILGGVDITCTVAPGIIFYHVYECGNTDADSASATVDTSAAGANLVLQQGTENTVNGSYVARIYKAVELNEEGTEVISSKKLHKYDGAVYAKQSMNVSGGGTLTIEAENEGLDTECHLTINGGSIVIHSGNDGINTNEDGVSVVTVNGGTLDITVAGTTGEGDGIDSNGWLVINGGSIIARAYGGSMDSGIDSDMGISINGGTVIATGNMVDRMDGDVKTFRMQTAVAAGREVTFKNADGEIIGSFTGENAYSVLVLAGADYADVATVWSGDTRLAEAGSGMGGFGGGMGPGGQRPEGFEGMEPPEGFEGGQMPEDFDPSQRPEGFGGGMGPGGQRPEGFEGMEPPEGFDPGQRPENGQMPENFDPGQRPEGFPGGQANT